ncbi:MAG: TIR domain-containing protein [Bacilli bacterium]|nr:TIR domain-containing protein [Bacilli bacterium]
MEKTKKTIYISYKYSESLKFRNKLIDLLGNREYRYYGEKFESPVILKGTEETVYKTLHDKIYQAHVVIVLISPNLLQSTWIPLEIDNALKEIKKGKATRRCGIIGLVIPQKGNDYSFIMNKTRSGQYILKKDLLPKIIQENMNNEILPNPQKDPDLSSYISIYRWDEFTLRHEELIDLAYEKATTLRKNYKLQNKIEIL